MTEARVLFAFVSFIIYAFVFAERGIDSAKAPFCSICSAILFFSLLGCVGQLRLAGWLYYLGAVVAAGYLVWRWAVQKKERPKITYGLLFFLAAGLWVVVTFWVRKPMFSTWDEFSFWGTSAKLAKIYDEFYTTAPVAWPWPGTFPPSLISLAYCVQFLGEGFVEWQVYVAYDLLQIAILSLLLAPFGRKDWKIVFPLAVIGILTPYLFVHYGHILKISSVYLDSMSDPSLGFLFGAVLLAWYGGDRGRRSSMVPVCLGLAVLTWTKDTGFAMALVAAVLILLDILLAKEKEPAAGKGRLKKGLASLVVLLVCILGPFFIWATHLGATTVVNRFELGGVENIGMMQMPAQFIRDLLSPEKSQRFLTVTSGMPRMLATLKMTMLGSSLMVLVFLVCVSLFSAFITKEPWLKRRCIVFGVFSALGFLAYCWLIGMTYIYIFREDQIFVSFERYIYPYLMGWFLAAMQLLGQSAKDSRYQVEGKGAVLALCALFCWRFWQFIPPAYSVFGFETDEYAERRGFSESVSEITRQIPLDSKTFIVSQDDNGEKWFTYCYEFLPYQLDFSYGGGTIAPPGALPEDTLYYHPVTPEELEQELVKGEVTHLYIDMADDLFIDSYGSLFADALEEYQKGNTRLYAAEQNEDGLQLAPVLE